MRDLINLIENADTKSAFDPSLLDGFDMSSYDEFQRSVGRNKDKVPALQAIWDSLKDRVPEGWTELYHGTPHKTAEEIHTNGFRLGKGGRSVGSMGARYTVDNQGIFLTDSKPMAHFFGKNRTDIGNHHMISCYVDLSRVINFLDIPREILKFGLDKLNSWNGTSYRAIPVAQQWWVLDNPQFISMIKGRGYTGTCFKEEKSVRKESGSYEPNSYLIFDPTRIKILKNFTLRDFYDWLVTHS